MMTLRKKLGLTVCLIFILSFLLNPLKTYSQTRISDEIELLQNQPAPYYGILMPEPKFRDYVEQSRSYQYLLDHPKPCEAPSDFKEGLAWLMSGLVAGFIGGLVVK